MGCNKRVFLLGICVSQLVATVWRQIFDFLGFMWCPIIINFFQIIFIIFGFFGAWQYKSSYTIAYSVWSLLSIAWNSFIFCFYMNIGVLNREVDLLSLGAGSISWWEANGPGCKALFLPNQTGIETEPWHPLRPDLVTGCVIPYEKLEASQAVLHIILAVAGLFLAFILNKKIKNGEEGKSSTLKKTIPSPLYPVDLMPRRVTNGPDYSDSIDDSDPRVSRPMTPRRVKRRSSSRGHSHATATLPRRHQPARSSLRSSRRHRTTPHHPHLHHDGSGTLGGHTNLMFQHSPENSFEEQERPPSARSSYSNYHGARSQSYRHFLVSGPPGYSSQSETAI